MHGHYILSSLVGLVCEPELFSQLNTQAALDRFVCVAVQLLYM